MTISRGSSKTNISLEAWLKQEKENIVDIIIGLDLQAPSLLISHLDFIVFHLSFQPTKGSAIEDKHKRSYLQSQTLFGLESYLILEQAIHN